MSLNGYFRQLIVIFKINLIMSIFLRFIFNKIDFYYIKFPLIVKLIKLFITLNKKRRLNATFL